MCASFSLSCWLAVSKPPAWQLVFVCTFALHLVLELCILQTVSAVVLSIGLPRYAYARVSQAHYVLDQCIHYCTQKWQTKSRLLDAPSFFFVSTGVADLFPHLVESALIKAHTSPYMETPHSFPWMHVLPSSWNQPPFFKSSWWASWVWVVDRCVAGMSFPVLTFAIHLVVSMLLLALFFFCSRRTVLVTILVLLSVGGVVDIVAVAVHWRSSFCAVLDKASKWIHQHTRKPHSISADMPAANGHNDTDMDKAINDDDIHNFSSSSDDDDANINSSRGFLKEFSAKFISAKSLGFASDNSDDSDDSDTAYDNAEADGNNDDGNDDDDDDDVDILQSGGSGQRITARVAPIAGSSSTTLHAGPTILSVIDGDAHNLSGSNSSSSDDDNANINSSRGFLKEYSVKFISARSLGFASGDSDDSDAGTRDSDGDIADNGDIVVGGGRCGHAPAGLRRDHRGTSRVAPAVARRNTLHSGAEADSSPIAPPAPTRRRTGSHYSGRKTSPAPPPAVTRHFRSLSADDSVLSQHRSPSSSSSSSSSVLLLEEIAEGVEHKTMGGTSSASASIHSPHQSVLRTTTTTSSELARANSTSSGQSAACQAGSFRQTGGGHQWGGEQSTNTIASCSLPADYEDAKEEEDNDGHDDDDSGVDEEGMQQLQQP
jgi:hypothetical protein